MPSFTYVQLASSVESAAATARSPPPPTPPPQILADVDLEKLRPISLVKCDDIKIHFDRRHVQRRTASNGQFSYVTNDGGGGDATTTTAAAAFSSSASSSVTPPTSVQPPQMFVNLLKSGGTDKQTEHSLYSTFVGGVAPVDFVNTFIPKEGEKLQNRYGSVTSRLSPMYYGGCGGGGSCSSSFGATTASSSSMDQQSLTRFLQAAKFSRAHNDLERENAHFSMCEAMISAIEQIKWSKDSNGGPTKSTSSTRSAAHHHHHHRSHRRAAVLRRSATVDNWDTNDKYRSKCLSSPRNLGRFFHIYNILKGAGVLKITRLDGLLTKNNLCLLPDQL